MKKVLKSNPGTKEYLRKLPLLYVVCCWANYGVAYYPFSGKCDKDGMPLVWQYDDHNGTCDNYYLRRLDHTTTGQIYMWNMNKLVAELIADNLRQLREYNREKLTEAKE